MNTCHHCCDLLNHVVCSKLVLLNGENCFNCGRLLCEEHSELFQGNMWCLGKTCISQQETRTLEFPSLGIKLSYLVSLVKELPLPDIATKTTKDVCDLFIKPTTSLIQRSYCEFLQDIEPSLVGKAQVFISHAWNYKFVEVIEALEEYFKDTPEIIIWFDAFSYNQHIHVNQPFEWWSTTFATAIQDIGNTVMVLAPWNNPLPLTRGWCVWELYCTIYTKSKFDVAMSKTSQQKFVRDINKDPTFWINAMLATINCKNIECFLPLDKERIFEAIQRTIGFPNLNTLVFETMREWVINKYQQQLNTTILELGTNNATTLTVMNNLGDLLLIQGRFEDAIQHFKECLEKRIEVLGEDNLDTLKTMHSLANSYNRQGNYNDGMALLHRCLEKKKMVSGKEHTDTLEILGELNELYRMQGRLAEADALYQGYNYTGRSKGVPKEAIASPADAPTSNEKSNLIIVNYNPKTAPKDSIPIYVQCLEKTKIKKGSDHPDTLREMSKLADLYSYHQEYLQAEILYRDCLETRKVILGLNHPQTLYSMQSLAGFLCDQNRFEEAEPLYLQCLENLTNLYSADYLATMHNLASLYSDQGKYDQAERMFKETLEKTKAVLGDNLPDTVSTMNSIAVLCRKQGKYDEAELLYTECLEKCKAMFGLNHPTAMLILDNLDTLKSYR